MMQVGLDLGHELVVDLFAGGGGTSEGIKRALGRDPDIAVNHDPQAVAMHEANHPGTEHFCESVFKVHPSAVTRNQPVGLLWASPDCFPAGTLILTDRGYRPIETLMEGDLVLTHAGRYRPVTATMTARRPVVRVRGQGHPGLVVSPEHPFYARCARNAWNNAQRHYDRTLEPPEWVKAKDLRTTGAPMNAAGGDLSFWATPCAFPPLPIPPVGGRGMPMDPRLAWLAGRYVGDGWSRVTGTRAELVLICAEAEADDLRGKLGEWPASGRRAGEGELTWHERSTATARQFSTNHRGLVEWLRAEFGHGAEAKAVPAWLLGADDEIRRAFLDGYTSADGHAREISGAVVWDCATASKPLAFSLRALIESLGSTAHVTGPSQNRDVIEGRRVKTRPIWRVKWRVEVRRPQNLRDGIHNWTRVRSVVDLGEARDVFNISVADDETYVAEGVVVHNCTHHSKAKGGKPVSSGRRGLAWVVVKWARRTRPRVIMLENVEEFADWGPLTQAMDKHGNPALDEFGRPILIPCKVRKGQIFQQWTQQLERLGYQVESKVLRACDFGAPTIRRRLFVIARRDGLPIIWPKPTHGPVDSLAVRRGKLQPYRTAAECIDWSLPCPSIFTRARPLADNTMRRIARGIQRFVLDDPQPFIVGVGGRMGQSRPRGVDEPFQTITSKADSCLATPFVTRIGHTGWNGDGGQYPFTEPLTTITSKAEHSQQQPRTRSVEQPMPTVTATANGATLVAAFLAKHYGGNETPGWGVRGPISTITAVDHHAVIATHLTRQFGQSVGQKSDVPMHTVMPGGGGKTALVAAHLISQKGTDQRHRDLRDPAPAICAQGNHAGLVAALMAPYYGSGSGETSRDLRNPAPTVTSRDRLQLVTVDIDGETYVLTDIGMRMLQPRELYRAQGFPDSYIIDQGPNGKTLPKHAQVRMCGNSVCPPVAQAIVAANFAHETRIAE